MLSLSNLSLNLTRSETKMTLKPGQTSKGVIEKSEKLAKGIDNRIIHLQWLLSYYQDNKELPAGAFIPKPNKLALREWDDPDSGIYKMSVNTFSKHRHKVDILLEMSSRINEIKEKIEKTNSPTRKRKKETIAYWKKKYKDEQDIIHSLTDELISLRTLYLDLLEKMGAHEQLSKSTQEAVKRHRMLYGSMSMIDISEIGES